MKYIVLGCNHGIQRLRPLNCFDDTPEVQRQRLHFRDLLAKVISESKIEVIAEERDDSQETIAQSLAKEHGICCPNIDAPSEKRESLGIPSDYLKGNYTDAKKQAWLRLREDFMLRRIKQEQGNAHSALVICGFLHMNPLAGLLQQGSTTVCISDYRKEDWYQPGVFTDDC